MATYSIGQNYRTITTDTNSVTEESFAIKALGGDVTVTATAASSNSDDLNSQSISDGDVITCSTGWTGVTKNSGSGTVIVYTKNT
jgi:hypothetical protein